MKLVFASDIHGSAYYARMLPEIDRREAPERIVLLGDLLYHGPRNDLPAEYNPKEVISILNGMKERFLCVRGNCDAEVDQMVLRFPVMADYGVMPVGAHLLYFTHGHTFNETTPPPLTRGDCLLCGHTHIPAFNRHEDFTYINPGSVSIPKNGSAHSYMTLCDGQLLWKDLESGAVYRSEMLDMAD